jgi:hypothetical protein
MIPSQLVSAGIIKIAIGIQIALKDMQVGRGVSELLYNTLQGHRKE